MNVQKESNVDIRENVKKGSLRWRVQVRLEELVFDSDWISIRIRDRDGAKRLAELVLGALNARLYVPPPGHLQNWDNVRANRMVDWREIDEDDWGGRLSVGACEAGMRVEHLSGPFRGGVWWWWSQLNGSEISQNETGIDGKKLEAARWLAELAAGALIGAEEG